MKFETFVTSGYKYGLLSCPDTNSPALRSVIKKCIGEGEEEQNKAPKRDANLEITLNPKTVVPFEDVDGLSLEELASYYGLLYRNRFLVFIMYDSVPIAERAENSDYRVEFKNPVERGMARYLYVIDTEKNKEATIDEVVEKQLIASMGSMNLQNRRRALGFLEKYVQSDRLETMQSIENYLRDIQDGSIRPYFNEYVKLPNRLIDQINTK